ncbi:uncharacterized protein I303_105341 [Kwoniella dejecticola CBS 10117]|uniref:CID domain-containing protein n=1 Tax=Kwoniella dejecticola CBS 10117 TaxID=1296121 RepID=A0A1A6A2S7_9TREE|nr:uncharacterized protein I303_05212 [Kwoniella dejecticola CBS 10117]OBR84354.1 hypothetical protein I303_05212 [Kwoniella dejecticola CBS 10117]
MADLKEFDKLLSATITAPRLSGSKVQKLATLSSELVHEDHHIVTTFFKLNASLAPASQSRISSLYVFDAIAREAKTQINKGVGTQIKKERGKGTQAGLLLKLEGVVDSWIEGLLDDGKGGVWIDGKEKTKKIVDIWSKASTFPQHCLERLSTKIQNAGPQAGPSSTPAAAPVTLKSAGRSASSGSGGKGSTTPPHPPPPPGPAPTIPAHAGGLPPEVAKLLGIAQPGVSTSISSPAPPDNLLSPSSNLNGGGTSSATPNSNPIIPNLDLAAILASVNTKPQSPTSNPVNHATSQLSSQAFNIPNLANLASLLPPTQSQTQTQTQNGISNPASSGDPRSRRNPPPSSGGPAPVPSPPSNTNPGLNAAQAAALAKFASLAQAGPPQSQSTTPSQIPPRPPAHQNAYDHQRGVSIGIGPSVDMNMNTNMNIPRRSPQKPFSDLPEPPRGNANTNANATAGWGPNPPSTHGHSRRISGDAAGGGNAWGRRGSYENDNYGGPSNQRNRNFNRQRSRSRSPNRNRDRDRDRERDRGGGTDRPSDNGWGNRGGRAVPKDHGPGPEQSFDRRPHYSDSRGPVSAQSQHGGPSSSFGAFNGAGAGARSGQPPNGIPNSQVNPSLPPRPAQNSNAHGNGSGRAPPPAWMEDRHDQPDSTNPNDGQHQPQAQTEEGEEDMALDDESDDGISSKPIIAPNTLTPQQQRYQQEQQHHHLPTNNQQLPGQGYTGHPTSGADTQDTRNDIEGQHSSSNYQQVSYNRFSNNSINEFNGQTQPKNPNASAAGPMMTLDTFPIQTFDPSSPDSWASLAQAWKNSMGKEPNQIELMAFLSGGMMGNMGNMGNPNT